MTTSADRRRHTVTLAVLAIGALAFSLAQTAIVPALGAMQRDFGVGANDLTWVMTADFLAASVATPVFGRLGDMFGKRRFLALSLAAFAIGSLVCALGDGLGPTIAGRALQGVGGGVFPLSSGIVRDELPLPRVSSGIALLGATAGVGGAIALPLGGLLVDRASYHGIFWISAALAVVAALATVRLVPESPVRSAGRIDLRGAALLTIGLCAVLVAISRADAWAWASPRTVGLAGAGLAILGLFAAFERRHPAPLVNMRSLSRPAVLITNLVTLLIGFGLFGTFILIPQIAQLPAGGDVGLGLSATEAGLVIAPGGVMILLAAPVAGWIGERTGPRLPLAVGAAVAALGLAALGVAHDSPGRVALWSAVFNTGVGCAFAAVPNLVIAATGSHETGEATGVNTIARNVGAALGGQVAASIVAGHVLTDGLPTDHGFELAFLSGAAITLLAALCALLIPSARRRGEGASMPRPVALASAVGPASGSWRTSHRARDRPAFIAPCSSGGPTGCGSSRSVPAHRRAPSAGPTPTRAAAR